MEFETKRSFFDSLAENSRSYLKWSVGEHELARLMRMCYTIDNYYSRDTSQVECSEDHSQAEEELKIGITYYSAYITCIESILSEIRKKRSSREVGVKLDKDLLKRETIAFNALFREENVANEELYELERKFQEVKTKLNNSQGKRDQFRQTGQL